MIPEVEDDRQIKCWQKVGNIELKKKLYYKNCWLLAFFSPFKKERNLTTLPLSSISSSSSNTKSCHKSQYEIGENNNVSCLLSVRSWKLKSLGLHFLLDSSGAKELLLSALLSKKYLRRRLWFCDMPCFGEGITRWSVRSQVCTSGWRFILCLWFCDIAMCTTQWSDVSEEIMSGLYTF